MHDMGQMDMGSMAHMGHSGGAMEHCGPGMEGHSVSMYRDRFLITLLLGIPVVFFSEMFQDLLNYKAPSFTGSYLIPAVLGTVIFLYSGAPFLRGARAEAKARQPGMMSLIALGITVAFGASIATEFGVLNLDFWWELAALIAVMLLGHWLEMRAVEQAGSALDALAALLPDQAERESEHGLEMVPVGALRVDDTVLVRPGGRVPADGELIDSVVEVDESMLTGESKLVAKETGDRLVAGTIVAGGSARIRVTAVGEQTALAGIRRLVEQAQQSRSRAQALADRAAAFLFYVASASGAITATVWLALGRPDDAIERAVSVLVISCPHALGLAIPLVISISTALAARSGILVKDRLALERMRDVDVVLFDKTGTLTAGRPVVTDAVALDGDRDKLLRLAAAVESDSEHPLARAIVAAANGNGSIPKASRFTSLTGRGVEATVDRKKIAVGGPSLLRERAIDVPQALNEKTSSWAERGATIIYVTAGTKVLGAVSLEDEVRPESREAVRVLREMGLRVAMVTGDAKPVAGAVAKELGIDEVFAEVLPEDKAATVQQLQGRGMRVAMVGDGVNDAPALATADVGIAIGAGTDVAIESAGIVLASDDPRAVVDVILLSRATYRKMVQNLAWATGYNSFAIPIAGGAFAWAGVTLSPAIAAILMSASTIVVALNAQLLRRLTLGAARRA
jgi:Cu2+-exporting ATPase